MDSITTYYLTQGVLGVTVVALIFVIVWQQKRIDSKDKQIAELQDKRIIDTNIYTQNYVETTKSVVVSTKDSIATINLLQRSIDSLATAFQSYVNRGEKL